MIIIGVKTHKHANSFYICLKSFRKVCMKRGYIIVSMFVVLLQACSGWQFVKKESPVKFVNHYIGTGGHGHTYPGAQLPFGMVQLSPDNGRSGWDWVSGYHYSDSVIVGFSHTHLSGTGIGDLQDISLMPSVVDFDVNKSYKDRLEKPYADFYSHSDEVIEPGYYRVNLRNSGIKAELTASLRSGFHRYTFPEKGEKNILLDLGYAQNWDAPTDTEVELVDDYTVKGKRFSSGWASDQRVFFYMRFSSPIIGLKDNGGDSLKRGGTVRGKGVKVLFKFDRSKDVVLVEVGISAVSTENARQNMEHENGDWNFDQVKKHASNEWEKALSCIRVEDSNLEKKTIFYSALYHAMLAPTLFSDSNNQYRGADTKVYETSGFDYYTGLSLWDTFRAQNPLLTILNPGLAVNVAKTMIAHFEATGTLPVWVLSGNETNTMTGYHSIPMLAEVVLKNLGDVDAERAYKAMKSTMLQKQRGLGELNQYGYVPYDKVDESVTISLELAYNDYAVAMVAKRLGYTEDYRYFLNRSMAYKYLFDKQVGFMRGKDSKGVWRPTFDPKHSSHRENTDYTEGNAWQHSWFVPHDIHGLVELFGSEESFEKQLTQLFNENSDITGDNVSPDITGLIGQYAHGNEPSHHIAYLYNYIGQPWKTQAMVHRIMKEQYHNAPDGISGNEDMGQMSAWYVLSALGFYPVNPVDGNFIIGTPLFEKCTISLKGGKSFVVSASNLSDSNFYIQSAMLNGKPLNRTYITYKEIMDGGHLEFKMGSVQNTAWGTAVESRPKSNFN